MTTDDTLLTSDNHALLLIDHQYLQLLGLQRCHLLGRDQRRGERLRFAMLALEREKFVVAPTAAPMAALPRDVRRRSVGGRNHALNPICADIVAGIEGKRDLLVPTRDGVREPQNRRVQIVYPNAATL